MTTAPPQPLPVAVLVSGGGTNLQALIDELPKAGAARVARVISNHRDAGALERARRAHIETAVLAEPENPAELLNRLGGIELVVLAGYLQYVPRGVVSQFRWRMINIHPALLPAFGGKGMYGHRVHEAVLASGTTITGATVHYVDEQYDHGPIIAQWPVLVHADDTPRTLGTRVLKTEHLLLTRVVTALAQAGMPRKAFRIWLETLDVTVNEGGPPVRRSAGP